MTDKKTVHGAIYMFFGALILTIVLAEIVGAAVDAVKARYGVGESVALQVATAPSVDLRPINSGAAIETPLYEQLVLNKRPYTPSPTVASDKVVFKNESIRILLDGEFKDAQLHIQGTVTERGQYFLDLIYGNVVGILYSSRYTATTLNTSLTQQYGGVFTSSAPIDVTIDLFRPVQLATTQAEFESTQKASKIVSLWNANPHSPPPVDLNLLVAPFNQNGHFGGAAITSTFQYTCKTKDKCHALLCEQGEPASSCVLRNYGKDIANDWCRREEKESCAF